MTRMEILLGFNRFKKNKLYVTSLFPTNKFPLTISQISEDKIVTSIMFNKY